MLDNKYDDNIFFDKYALMLRSKVGLNGASEWEDFKIWLPSLKDKVILDLGCGYGWHSIYALENGAKEVFTIDLSLKMLDKAKIKTNKYKNKISFYRGSCEEINKITDLQNIKFDIVISSLVFYYIKDYEKLIFNISKLLNKNISLVFSVEHLVFTANISQDFIYKNEDIQFFPVKNYFYENKNKYNFLGEDVVKYHRILTSYISPLLQNNFKITNIIEPKLSNKIINLFPEFKNEFKKRMT
ncbi:class I SAM-dependent methyltransferase [Campylobacter lari]|uniref:class I SAM-dependent methyltransferase n=1 Tax=Campylobacter lari TaxID=201 RepID=UPI00128587BF|nr:class I SAM-dependent methyltransferase [Campylobacter lari]EAJ0340540.1 class I SAM-dependent methyltransferase [Campylobacter lari]EAK9938773.1 class I SAM-dependent methyltransferase [Campylobacter lari]EGK1191057.1 class I SAM-dependent methyltransferase [Campylobacter lari]